MSGVKINSHFLPLICETMRNAPVKWERLLEGRAVTLPGSPLEDSFIDSGIVGEIFEDAMEECGEEDLVLRYFKAQETYFFPTIFGSMLRVSADMEQFMALCRRYFVLSSFGSADLNIEEKGEFCRFSFSFNAQGRGMEQLEDFILLYIKALFRILSAGDFQVTRIELTKNDKLIDHPVYLEHFPEAKIVGGHSALAFYIPMNFMKVPFPDSDPKLIKVLQRNLDTELKIIECEGDFLQKVMLEIYRMLRIRTVSGEALAVVLDMSRATLSRRLASRGTSFQRVYDEVRRRWAVMLLMSSTLSEEEIGDKLDFSSLSNFNRFFKRVEGTTLRRFRKNSSLNGNNFET